MVATLISYNHQNVLDYGYSFFKISCESLEKRQKIEILGLSTAIGLAFCSEKERKKFIKEF
ncbi:hypothetical protein DRH14_03975 [Candidatus Shapirobacteria bacterium]|nr:MAG: hypothetical protein DRH14_03975 [Candidatus Shapirobacteria bacterium]